MIGVLPYLKCNSQRLSFFSFKFCSELRKEKVFVENENLEKTTLEQHVKWNRNGYFYFYNILFLFTFAKLFEILNLNHLFSF